MKMFTFKLLRKDGSSVIVAQECWNLHQVFRVLTRLCEEYKDVFRGVAIDDATGFIALTFDTSNFINKTTKFDSSKFIRWIIDDFYLNSKDKNKVSYAQYLNWLWGHEVNNKAKVEKLHRYVTKVSNILVQFGKREFGSTGK